MSATQGATDPAILDIVDLMVEFNGFETPAITQVRTRVATALNLSPQSR